jgi:hypothetical protein
MADQAQKIALHATGALPPTTKTSPRITIAVSYFSRPSFLLRWGLLGQPLTLTGPQARAIASPNLTIVRAGFAPGKNSTYASFISL